MRTTKNEKLIRDIADTCDMVHYYTNHAHKLLEELRNTKITRTEEERWNTKERLIEDLESITY